jgi:hypothetical protein
VEERRPDTDPGDGRPDHHVRDVAQYVHPVVHELATTSAGLVSAPRLVVAEAAGLDSMKLRRPAEREPSGGPSPCTRAAWASVIAAAGGQPRGRGPAGSLDDPAGDDDAADEHHRSQKCNGCGFSATGPASAVKAPSCDGQSWPSGSTRTAGWIFGLASIEAYDHRRCGTPGRCSAVAGAVGACSNHHASSVGAHSTWTEENR